MSAVPKYSPAELAKQQQEKLEADRRREAEREAQQRKAEAERQRVQRVANVKQIRQDRCQEIERQVKHSNIHEADTANLIKQLQQQRDRIGSATQESQLGQTEQDRIVADLNRAVDRKQRDDAEKKRMDELEKVKFACKQLQIQCDRIPLQDVKKFDPEGKAQADRFINALQQAITSGNPATAQSALVVAQQSVDLHIQQVSDRRNQWQQAKAKAEVNMGEIQALMAGLAGDQMFMGWQKHQFAFLGAIVTQADTDLKAEQFDRVASSLNVLKERTNQMLEQANTAQLKADKRDYISDAIAQSMQEMGFSIRHRKLEHDHPASAVIIVAAKNSGKSISISVPTEGEVLYDVDKGYPIAGAICDEAEQVLEQMHGILNDQFGVQMGEITWEGKNDPNRNLRRADELPQAGKAKNAK